MDEYLSEKEQIEQIKQWWNEYGWYLLGGALLAGLGYLGYNQFQAWQQRVAEQQAGIYHELQLALEDDDRDTADDLLNQLATEHAGSIYLDQARLLIAEENLIREPDRAISELETVVDESSDEGLARIARLRLARVLAFDEQYDRALDLLNIADPGEFDAQFSEVRGDVHAAMGNTEAALTAYTEALLGSANGSINTDIVQLKINDLNQRLESVAGEDG